MGSVTRRLSYGIGNHKIPLQSYKKSELGTHLKIWPLSEATHSVTTGRSHNIPKQQVQGYKDILDQQSNKSRDSTSQQSTNKVRRDSLEYAGLAVAKVRIKR